MPKLTQRTIDEIKRAEPIANYLTPAAGHPKEYACIKCGSSHHAMIFDDNTVTCMKCRNQFDLIEAKQAKEGRDFLETAKAIAEAHNIPLEYEDGPAPDPKPKEKTEDLIQDPPKAKENTQNKYKYYIADWKEDADKAREYLNGRGINDETIAKYDLGYKVQYFPEAGEELPAVVFSYNGEFSYFGARSISKEGYFYKPKTADAGEEPLFRPESLNSPQPCFVVESQLDALSILQTGAPAVALCGTGYSKLLTATKDRKTPLILFLDNDPPNENGKRPGPEAQANLARDLKERGTPYREAVIDYSKYAKTKDANDLLQSNAKQFAEDIAANIRAASDPTGIEAFLQEVNTERYKPIPTGITALDSLLCGGFLRQSLILLGAIPGGGKTALAAQIFESMAEAGAAGIFLNLEMSQAQLIARSLARRIFANNPNYKLTALDILQTYRLSEESKLLVQEAANGYKSKVGNNLVYNPAGVGTDLDGIIDYIIAEGDKAQREGRPAPNICIDYLHLLTGKPGEDTAAILKRAVYAFKDYAVKYNAVVFAIEAQNRAANQSAEAILEAGRDSSGLEYGGDLILQLIREDKERPEEVKLCVTKSRFTAANFTGEKFILHGGQSYMEPAEEWQAPSGENPFI